MRVSLHVTGTVQGVGFRPFVQLQASRLGLSGWIKNGRSGVDIEVSGTGEHIAQFCRALEFDLPLPGKITTLERKTLIDAQGLAEAFRILPSDEGEEPRALLPPDLATCPECLEDVLSPTNRRHLYALTCCARCGPRYSIVEQLPYDRSRTTMRSFEPCADCRREYEDPTNRRFHAEPIACPRCGPRVFLLSNTGQLVATTNDAIDIAATHLRNGAIVALRGLGGFQLLCLATETDVIKKLRQRKLRSDKPFAVLFSNLEKIIEQAYVSPVERAALTEPSAPIVLLRRKESATISPEMAPHCPLVGAMLPTTAMHNLLADAVDAPLVCTSGNLSGEPLCVDTPVALERLGSIADVFLTHDRPIVRPMDDSVVREGARGVQVLRRARGYAPLPAFRWNDTRCILGMGAYLKNSVSLLVHGDVVMSQHLGDLDDPASVDLLETTVRDLLRFFDVRPEIIACDLHPDFASTRLAERLSTEWTARLVRVQHHHAHVASVMAERGIEDEVFALVWDGYGFGLDGQAWGGEAFVVRPGTFQRIGHLQPFRLPGGDKAASEPRRSALGLLNATLGKDGFARAKTLWPDAAAEALWSAMDRGFASPWTTSMGRLFDAVAALLGIRRVSSYEGQAAMELEWCAETHPGDLPEPYSIPLTEGPLWMANLEPLVAGLLAHSRAGMPISEMAARFISSVVELGVRFCKQAGLSKVVLAGGCFQNDLLTRALVRRLEQAGFEPHLPTNVPINDGGISAGQVAIASQASMLHGDN